MCPVRRAANHVIWLCDVTTLSPHSRQYGGEGEESQMREKKRCLSRHTERVVVISAHRAKSSALVTYWPPAMSGWFHRICEQARACLRPVHFSIFIWKSGFTLDPSGYIKDMKTKKRQRTLDCIKPGNWTATIDCKILRGSKELFDLKEKPGRRRKQMLSELSLSANLFSLPGTIR